MFFFLFFFFFKQKTAYEIGVRLVGSEMCIRDSLYWEAATVLFYYYRDEVSNVRISVLSWNKAYRLRLVP